MDAINRSLKAAMVLPGKDKFGIAKFLTLVIRQAEQAARADEEAKSVEIIGALSKNCFEAVTQARKEEREKAAETAEAHGPLISGSPGPLFDAGWNTACNAIAEAIRALKDKP